MFWFLVGEEKKKRRKTWHKKRAQGSHKRVQRKQEACPKERESVPKGKKKHDHIEEEREAKLKKLTELHKEWKEKEATKLS